ncbi:MAG TPA: STAS domain-containing protein [Candidatus Nanopelagicales bacterium]|nr:STAS domain-containing protein [Candidatus Nanopelagicales bacterium]
MTLLLAGDLTVERQPELEEYARHFRESRCRSLTLDLSQVDFMDSMGLRLVFVSLMVADARGGEVTVVARSSQVRRCLQLVGIGHLLADSPAGPDTPGGGDGPGPVRGSQAESSGS